MATILVSLVSDQTIPNVLFIKETPNIDRYLLMSTEKMEKQGKSECIMEGSGTERSRFFDPLVVVEDSLVDIEEQLKTLDFDDDDHFLVNLTGGTKIMSIGAYNFFRNRQSEIVYVPIGKNIYRKIFPDAKQRDRDMACRLGVTDYLHSYGIDILHGDQMNSRLRTPEATAAFFEYFCQAPPEDLAIFDALRDFRSKKNTPVDKVNGLTDLLTRCPFKTKHPEKLSKYEVQYLTGEWFEEYAYTMLKQHFDLSDTAIGRSVKIQRRQNNAQNEFDILFTRENALYVIECKTSIFDPRSAHNLMNETLHKLAALRPDFGLFVKAFLFTLSEPGSGQDQIRPAQMERSRLFSIRVVDGTRLHAVHAGQETLSL